MLLNTRKIFSDDKCSRNTPFNTRTGGGGGKKCPPLRFFADSGKRRCAAPPFFQNLLTIELDTLCENFNLRSPKVRSPGQVKVKNGFLTLRLRSSHTRYPISFKPSAFHKAIDTYNLYISDFLYLSPEHSGTDGLQNAQLIEKSNFNFLNSENSFWYRIEWRIQL